MDKQTAALTEKLIQAIAADLESHKKAIERLVENQNAEHAKVVEIAARVNEHSEALESLRKMLQSAWPTVN